MKLSVIVGEMEWLDSSLLMVYLPEEFQKRIDSRCGDYARQWELLIPSKSNYNHLPSSYLVGSAGV